MNYTNLKKTTNGNIEFICSVDLTLIAMFSYIEPLFFSIIIKRNNLQTLTFGEKRLR